MPETAVTKDVGGWLTRPVGPLPLWGWAALAGGGALALRLATRPKRATTEIATLPAPRMAPSRAPPRDAPGVTPPAATPPPGAVPPPWWVAPPPWWRIGPPGAVPAQIPVTPPAQPTAPRAAASPGWYTVPGSPSPIKFERGAEIPIAMPGGPVYAVPAVRPALVSAAPISPPATSAAVTTVGGKSYATQEDFWRSMGLVA